jgi:two-component system phosphate regulon response regulator PhoB
MEAYLTQAKPPSVLVVDDEPAILRMIAVVLRQMGLEPWTTTSAEQALAFLDSARPDLVIADVFLPGLDGLELTRRIKAKEELASVPVLLISAYGQPANHEGDGFLAKPFDIDEFVFSVTSFLNRQPPAK